MTDAVNEVEVKDEVAQGEEAPHVGTIMEYINGLMIGTIPQEFFEKLVSKIGLPRVNQAIALGGVKYMASLREGVLKDVMEANDEAVTIDSVLDKVLPQLTDTLEAIFGK